MITRAADESAPLQHTQWRIWQELVVRFRFFEIAPIQDWARLIARLDSRAIRTAGCLNGIPFSDFISADWGSGNSDMILTLWQAYRPLISAGETGSQELDAPDSRALKALTRSLRKATSDPPKPPLNTNPSSGIRTGRPGKSYSRARWNQVPSIGRILARLSGRSCLG